MQVFPFQTGRWHFWEHRALQRGKSSALGQGLTAHLTRAAAQAQGRLQQLLVEQGFREETCVHRWNKHRDKIHCYLPLSR